MRDSLGCGNGSRAGVNMLCTRCNSREALAPDKISSAARNLEVELPAGLCSHCLANDPLVQRQLATKGRETIDHAVSTFRGAIANALDAIDEWVAPPK